jgi:ferredoxin
MAYYINDDCISCGACESECPVNCISASDFVLTYESMAHSYSFLTVYFCLPVSYRLFP